MKTNKKWPIQVLLLLLFITTTLPSYLLAENNEKQQTNTITIKGVVTDANKEPLIGVSVQVKGTTNGASTGIDGDYTLNVTPGNHTLVFSYIGFQKQEINTNGRTTIDVEMQEDAELLDEVVVVGYGVQKKVNLTGSVSSVNKSKLENRPTPNLATSLAGLSTGVNVTQSSGQPGSEGVNFTIRGQGSFIGGAPMVLVDGAQATMGSVNPDDVESISFLKDGASAAIYGSRAANGVILITTKKGNGNSAPKVTYSNVFASQKAQSKWKLMSDMPTWMKWHNQAQLNTDPSISSSSLWYDQYLIDTWAAANSNPNGTDNGYGIPNWMAYPNTDWAQEIFKASFFQKHNLSVSGGSKISNYLLSVGFQDNPGTFDNTGEKRYNIRANVETKIADIITFGTQTYATKSRRDPGDVEAAYRYLAQAYPGINPEIDGKYGAAEDPNMSGMNNPLRSVALKGGEKNETTINTTWFAKGDIWNGISAEVRFNYQNIYYDDHIYSKDVPAYRFRNGTSTPVEGIGKTETAIISKSYHKTESYLLNFLLHYNKSFGDHNISALAGYEQTFWQKSGVSASRQGMTDWTLTDINSAANMNSIGGQKLIDYAMISYFGRVNYDYMGRYLLEANLRADASSMYAPGHRWGYFPSFSAGWRVSEEEFFKPLKPITKIDDLKLRVSWGKLGNVFKDQYYPYQGLYSPVNGILGQGISQGLGLSQNNNPLLSWENVATTDIGVDIYMLNKRLNVGFDYYNKSSSDLLVGVQPSLSMGTTVGKQYQNLGKMTNKGIELSLGWNDKIGKVRYNVDFNVTYNTNKVTQYKGDLDYSQLSGQFDIWGRPVYGYTNLGEVSEGSRNLLTQGHIFNEFYLNQPYSGSGSYYNKDGSVNPKGGPKNGIIRTKDDLEWVNSMIKAGYNFNGATVDMPKVDANGNITGGRGNYLWYGSQIMADENGDGTYGDSNDKVFTGKSAAPKWMLGISLGAEWNGFDFSMSWDARLGSYTFINQTSVNGNITQNFDGINAKAGSMYYQYDAVASIKDYDNYDPATDPNANINARYPKLLGAASIAPENTLYLYNTSFLKLRSVQIGYTLPKKWVNSVKLSNVRVFFAGENLLTIKDKDFPGVDPELADKFKVYPISRMFSGGFNVTF